MNEKCMQISEYSLTSDFKYSKFWQLFSVQTYAIIYLFTQDGEDENSAGVAMQYS